MLYWKGRVSKGRGWFTPFQPAQSWFFDLNTDKHKTMTNNKGMIDSGVIIGGLILVLIIGVFVMLGGVISSQVQTSLTNTMATSTVAIQTIGNATENVNSSYILASNIPIVVVAAVVILVMLSMAMTLA
jgi:hypothetical protein